MIAPPLSDLLGRTADALAETVAAALPPGYLRTQIDATVSIMRRAAHAWDALAPTLDADIRDIRQTLLSLSLPAEVHSRVREAAIPSEDFPTLKRLSAVHQGLQEILLEVPDSPELRDLFRRMLSRERGLNIAS